MSPIKGSYDTVFDRAGVIGKFRHGYLKLQQPSPLKRIAHLLGYGTFVDPLRGQQLRSGHTLY